ncbi:Senecionine N-oxygenase [Recurvomyces mirabilis]|uniref:glutaminase n=1 Tax=Recurvomyces mirabilis TaxID=574656 RepID=A0AAE1C401_9PEZI|nr:Senecionine N-oxygenase [Recurvomyces mirabilis]KAK5156976.1 Senecionine N-oxygenase [Recurvomyces mirabilis]
MPGLTVGVLALQGAFVEHIKLLRQAADELQARWVAAAGEEWEASQPRQGGVTDMASRRGGEDSQMPQNEEHQHEHAVGVKLASATVRTPGIGQSGPEVGVKSHPSATADPLLIHITEVRTPYQLSKCAALVLPGGESTSISLIAARTGLLDPLRDFVKVRCRPVWGTCAGLILLAEEAVESFEAELDLGSFLGRGEGSFHSVFIRAPVVEKVLVASKSETSVSQEVEILGRLPGRAKALRDKTVTAEDLGEEGDIVAVKQGNVFGTAFHPELTGDGRIHLWWLNEVVEEFVRKQKAE